MGKLTSNKNNPWQNFHGPNLGYVMEMYDLYLHDPDQVDEDLKQLFQQWGPPVIEGKEISSETAPQTFM